MQYEKRKKPAPIIALKCLMGTLAAIPEGMDVEEILAEFDELGGIELLDSPKKIKKDALQYCSEGSRISYIIANRYKDDYGESFVLISFVVDTPENSVRTETDVLNDDGVLAYVYNVTVPYLSELGYVSFEKDAKGRIYRAH